MPQKRTGRQNFHSHMAVRTPTDYLVQASAPGSGFPLSAVNKKVKKCFPEGIQQKQSFSFVFVKSMESVPKFPLWQFFYSVEQPPCTPGCRTPLFCWISVYNRCCKFLLFQGIQGPLLSAFPGNRYNHGNYPKERSIAFYPIPNTDAISVHHASSSCSKSKGQKDH